MKLWPLHGGPSCATLAHDRFIYSIDVQGDTLAAGCDDKMVWLWSLASRTCTRKLSGHTDSVLSVRLLGDLLVSGAIDSTARVWSVGSGECVATLTCRGKVCGLAISPRGLIASASSGDKKLRVWRPQ